MAFVGMITIIYKLWNKIRLRRRKSVQFITLFDLLQLKRPIIDFESIHGFLQILKVKNNLDKNWINTNGWGMAKCMTNLTLQAM